MDKQGNKSGQLDIIVEKLHSISFPANSQSNERLYLAEMVSAVISVKSTLSSQWGQVVAEAEKLGFVQSSPTAGFSVNARKGNVPLFVVAYGGAWTDETFSKKLQELPKNTCIEGICVLDTEFFAVQTRPGSWVCQRGPSSFLYFMSQLHLEMTRNFAVGENIWSYVCEVTKRE